MIAVLSFVGIRIPERSDTSDQEAEIDVSGYLSDLRDGVQWLRGTVFTEMMLTTAVTNFGTGIMFAVLPGFVAVRGDLILCGALLGAIGAGGLIGALIASRLTHVRYGIIRIIGLGVGFFLWTGAAYSPVASTYSGLVCDNWDSNRCHERDGPDAHSNGYSRGPSRQSHIRRCERFDAYCTDWFIPRWSDGDCGRCRYDDGSSCIQLCVRQSVLCDSPTPTLSPSDGQYRPRGVRYP